MGDLLINCSYNIEDYHYFLRQGKIEENRLRIVDLTASIASRNLEAHYVPRTWDINNEIELHAHKEYINIVGDLGEDFKKIHVNGLPIYWLTNMAIKHPIYCPAIILFYLKNILQFDKRTRQIISDANLAHVLLPSNCKDLKELVPFWFESFGLKEPQTILRKSLFKRRPIKRALIFIKDFISKSFYIRRKGLNSLNNWKDLKSNVLLTKNVIPLEDIDLGHVFKQHENYFDPIYIPEVLNFPIKYFKEPNLYKRELSTLAVFPTVKQVLGLIYKSTLAYFILKIKISVLDDNIEKSILKGNARKECFNELSIFESGFSHIWYCNLFSAIEKHTNFVYTDEFYRFGRIISNAAKVSGNKNVKTFGLQHGLIGEHHTVYKLCDKEIKGPNATPIPNHFIVWGEAFKRFFLNYNSLGTHYVRIAAHPKLLKLTETNKTNLKQNKQLRMLWCTTLKEPALFEFYLIKDFIPKYNLDICLRQHPLHLILNNVKQALSKEEIYVLEGMKLDNNKFIKDTILDVDFVVCSSSSTVFLDSLILNKPVICVDSKKLIFSIPLSNSNKLMLVSDETEFETALQHVLDFKKHHVSNGISEIISLDRSLIDLLNEPLNAWPC